MAKKLTIMSTKGGVGKTTLAANLGAALADLGQRVLLIDTDKQQSLSKYYPLVEQAPNGLKEMIQWGYADDCISTTNIEHLDIIVNNDPDEHLKAWIAESPSNHIHYLASALEGLDNLYDVIIIDTIGTGNLGGLQEMAIRASDHCISPLSPDWLAAKELPNTIALLGKLEPPKGLVIGRPIPPLTVIIWGKQRNADNQKVVDNVSNDEGSLFQSYFRQANSKFSVLKTVVPYNASYNKATGVKVPIHRYEPKRPGPTMSGAETMLSLACELFSHLVDAKFKEIKNS